MITEPSNVDRSVLRRLMEHFSVEITSKEAKRTPSLSGFLPLGTAVYIPFLPQQTWTDTVETAARVHADGMRPVPHLAARTFSNAQQVRRILASLIDVGVTELMLIAGSMKYPAGEFHSSMQILRSGLLEEAGVTRVGLAAHPEGNPDIDEPDLRAALADKNAVAREVDIDLYLVTQFCFAPEPLVSWERRTRADGNALPIIVGLPGVTSPARLVRFGLSCGVGASLQVLRKQTGGLLKLATTSVYHPEETLAGVVREASDPESQFCGIHFFPFGSLTATARWAQAVRDGYISLDDDADYSA